MNPVFPETAVLKIFLQKIFNARPESTYYVPKFSSRASGQHVLSFLFTDVTGYLTMMNTVQSQVKFCCRLHES